MFDRNAQSSKEAFAELENKELRVKILRYALWRTGSEAEADDLIADAIECVCDPERKPWDRAKISFFHHIRNVMDDLATQRGRRGPKRFEVASDELDSVAADPVAAPLPEQALHAKRALAWLRKLGDRVRAAIGERDPLAAKVFDAACEGHEDPAEQAAAIGCTVEEVYEAHRRLRYRGAKVKEEAEAEEEARMKALREAHEAAQRRDAPQELRKTVKK